MLIRTRKQLQAVSTPQLDDCYDFVKNLGKGGEGEVEKYVNKSTGVVVAVKFRQRRDRGQPHEVEVLKNMSRNKSVVGFVECFDLSLRNCAVVLEYCPHGDLYDFYKRKERSEHRAIFSERFMWSVFKQLARAIAFIHKGSPFNNKTKRPVVHCDIKLDNILIKSLGEKPDFSSISIKLADFGLARYHNPRAKSDKFSGTAAYAPPEIVWDNPKYTTALDVWGMGAVMHVLAHGYPPLEDPQDTAMRRTGGHARQLSSNRERFFRTRYPDNDWRSMKARRVVVSIALEPQNQSIDSRRKRPTPKYSDALDKCFTMALEMNPRDRAKAIVIAEELGKLRWKPWWPTLCRTE